MKLRNKKTGEIVEVESCNSTNGTIGLFFAEGIDCDRAYSSLAELNEEWEDYEEDKYYYAITSIKVDNGITKMKNKHNDMTAFDKSIGNYFKTKEEAEEAVEKLKAWKRLKDKGFKFVGWEDTNNDVNDILFELPYMEWDKNVSDDLDSLFGGEK